MPGGWGSSGAKLVVPQLISGPQTCCGLWRGWPGLVGTGATGGCLGLFAPWGLWPEFPNLTGAAKTMLTQKRTRCKVNSAVSHC